MATSHTIAGSSPCTATPDEVWALWTDPAAWPGGPIVAAELHGAFEAGGKITAKVKGYRPLTSTVTRIERPKVWTGVAKMPGLTMTIDHVIETTDGGTLLTERAALSGPLAALVDRFMGRRIAATYDATTAYCAQRVEADAARPQGEAGREAQPPG